MDVIPVRIHPNVDLKPPQSERVEEAVFEILVLKYPNLLMNCSVETVVVRCEEATGSRVGRIIYSIGCMVGFTIPLANRRVALPEDMTIIFES